MRKPTCVRLSLPRKSMFALKKLQLTHSIPAVYADLDVEQERVWAQLDRTVEQAQATSGLLTLLCGQTLPDEQTLIFRATRPEVIAVLAEGMAARGLCGYLLTGQADVSQSEFQALLGSGLVLMPDAGKPLGGLSFAELRRTLEMCVTRVEDQGGLRIPAVFIPRGDSPYDGLTLRALAQLGFTAFAPHTRGRASGVSGYAETT